MSENKPIRLHANESSLCSFGTLLDILPKLENIELNRYPDADCTRLRKVFADKNSLSEDMVVCGNGSDELIQIIMQAYLERKNVVIHSPTFTMYEKIATQLGGSIIPIACDESLKIDVEKIIETATSDNVSMVIICSPNNPTGTVLGTEEILHIADSVKCPVVVDEAYLEFSGLKSVVEYVNKFRNLIVLRTMSKAYGLAAIRVGFAAACREVAERIDYFRLPYNLNSISQAIAIYALENSEAILPQIELVREQKQRLLNELSKLSWLRVYGSYGNFLFVTGDIKRLMQALDKKVEIRFLTEDTARITVGLEAEVSMVIELIKNS